LRQAKIRGTRPGGIPVGSTLALAFAAIALVACGPDESSSNTPDPGADSDSAWPVSIEHKYGTTEISDEPERVVTVGLTDHDALLALGIAPVGVTDWYGDHAHATWPWAQDELGGAEPVVVGNATELNFEEIAALEPDVIVGLYSAMTEEDYETLSGIAPTVAQPSDHVDYGIPWQELTRTVGQVVGQPENADALVNEVEERFDKVRADYPEFKGASAAIATPYEGIYVYSDDVANGRLLSSLGFELPDELADLIGDADGSSLSLERVDLLDVDLLVWLDATDDKGPLGSALYQNLDVHTEGRELLVESASDLGGAMSFSSALSLPYLLDELVPMLEVAVDGDPATS